MTTMTNNSKAIITFCSRLCVGLNLFLLGFTACQCCCLLLGGLCLCVKGKNLVLCPVVFQLVIGQFTYLLGDRQLAGSDESCESIKVVAVTVMLIVVFTHIWPL